MERAHSESIVESLVGFNITLVSGENLSLNEPCHPWVVFTLGEVSRFAGFGASSVNPLWNETLFLPSPPELTTQLNVAVYSKGESAVPDCLGSSVVDLRPFRSDSSSVEEMLLFLKSESDSSETPARLHVRISPVFGDSTEPSPLLPDDGADGVSQFTSNSFGVESKLGVQVSPEIAVGVSTTFVPSQSSSEESEVPQYRVISRIGHGGFGHVFLVEMKKNGNRMAMKKVYCETRKEVNDAMKEVFIVRDFVHPNIVRSHDVCFEENSGSESDRFRYALCIFTNYYELGDLECFIRRRARRGVPFDERLVLSYMWQLCDAVSYLHQRGYVHRDIKPANIYLSNRWKTLSIGDFGLVRNVDGVNSVSSRRGTLRYLAPESAACQHSLVTPAGDIWGLGVVFYYICTLELSEVFYLEVYKNPNFHSDVETKLKRHFSDTVAGVVLSCLKTSPDERPTCEQLKERILASLDSPKVVRSAVPQHASNTQSAEPPTDEGVIQRQWQSFLKLCKSGVQPQADPGPALELERLRLEEMREREAAKKVARGMVRKLRSLFEAARAETKNELEEVVAAGALDTTVLIKEKYTRSEVQRLGRGYQHYWALASRGKNFRQFGSTIRHVEMTLAGLFSMHQFSSRLVTLFSAANTDLLQLQYEGLISSLDSYRASFRTMLENLRNLYKRRSECFGELLQVQKKMIEMGFLHQPQRSGYREKKTPESPDQQ